MIPAVFSHFFFNKRFMFTRVTGALRAQPLAVSLRPYEPNRFFLRGPAWPRVAFFLDAIRATLLRADMHNVSCIFVGEAHG